MPYGINTAKHETCFCEPGKTLGRGVPVPVVRDAAVCTSPLNRLHMRNVCLEWDTRVQLCLLGQAEIEIKTDQTTVPWKVDFKSQVSFEIDFHRDAPPYDWQLHLSIYFL